MIAAELASRGVKLELVVDEGTCIVMDGLPPLYSSPVALVATAEKVYVQVEVRVGPGHACVTIARYARPCHWCLPQPAGADRWQYVQHRNCVNYDIALREVVSVCLLLLLHCCCCCCWLRQVTLSSKGGHSSMPPVDGSSIGDRLGRFLSAISAAPGAIELVRPTSDFLAELGKLLPGEPQPLSSCQLELPPFDCRAVCRNNV
jgi:hypothetical protein